MATPQPCPRANLSDLPNLSRDVPAFLFLPACLPGKETASGCAAGDMFYTVAVPWSAFLAQGWEAPGGNRYWATTIPANLRDPRVPALLKLMAARSRDDFKDTFASDKRPVKYLIDPNAAFGSITAQRWKTRIGDLAVQVVPDPNETIKAFIKRGGYLLDSELILKGGRRLQAVGAQPWMGSKIERSELWGSYDPAAKTVSYTIRVVYKGAWSQTVTDVDAWLRKNLSAMCAKASSTEAMTAAAALTAFPATAPYLAAYGAVLSMCGLSLAQLPCVPQPPLPGEVNAATNVANTSGAVIQSVKAGTAWGNAASAAGAMLPASAGVLAPATFPQPGVLGPGIPGAYPDGTIAWYDTGAGGYRVAVPFPGPSTTHRILSAGVIPRLPATGIQLVTKTAWERATLPWLQRTTTKFGMMIGGVAAAGAATVYAATRD